MIYLWIVYSVSLICLFIQEAVLLILEALCFNNCPAAAAAAAKSLQSCPTLCDPIDGSLPGFPVPGILQARTLEWVAIAFSVNNYNVTENSCDYLGQSRSYYSGGVTSAIVPGL